MKEETRVCQNCKVSFAIDASDFAFYEKIKVPPPTWCPECRMIRRFVFRNERLLFRRKDDASGKEIFSEYPPEVHATVYDHDYWLSDKWDSMDYGRDYDFSRPFFEQFREFMYQVPWASRTITALVNSDYSNHCGYLKNCYLCFNFGASENCAYGNEGNNQKECFDVVMSDDDELCYESMGVDKSYQTFFSNRCEECQKVWFSRDCIGCSNCFGCANLRNKQYYIFNKPYSKEGYESELRKFNLSSYQSLAALKQSVKEFWFSVPYKFIFSWHSVNVSGDNITFSKNVAKSFIIKTSENIKYCQYLFWGAKDSYDYSNWGESELMYEVFGSGLGCKGVKFAWDCWPADQELEYCIKCRSSSNLFGCVGLKNKSYCIFNTQYSKEDYFALRQKIIRHMDEMPYTDAQGKIYRYGEFFPPEFSPLAYNETLAQDFFPLTKEQATAKGYAWRDSKAQEHQATIDATHLPDDSQQVDESLLKEIIRCALCAKAYRLIPMELAFYRKMLLPIPRFCPNCRFLERAKLRNPPVFYQGKCQCTGKMSENGIYSNADSHFHGSSPCPNEFETSYAPERKEIIYCEQCYQAEVV